VPGNEHRVFRWSVGSGMECRGQSRLKKECVEKDVGEGKEEQRLNDTTEFIVHVWVGISKPSIGEGNTMLSHFAGEFNLLCSGRFPARSSPSHNKI
jgi:hypothetical protein